LSGVLFYWPFSKRKVEINIVRRRKLSAFVVLLVLLYQLVYPIGSVFAAESGVLLPPSNLAFQAATPDDGKLVWSSVYGATGYNVYQIADGQLILLGTTKTNSYSLNNLAEGSYSYVISTVSADGESGPCAPVDITIDYPTMATPATLTSEIKNGNDIVLTWGSSPYAETYNIYEKSLNGTSNLVNTTSSRTYTVVNATEGTHSYTVSAVNSLYGESSATAPIEVNVVYPIMKEPTNLSFSITNGNDINLKWQASSYANSYKIYQIIDNQEIFKTSVTTASAVFTNMSEGDYVYKVYSSSDRFGVSETGTSISVHVNAVTMTPPANASGSIQNLNDIVLSWSKAPYAESYNIYQIINGQKLLQSTVSTATTTFTNLPAGDYVYEITSYSNRFGESASSSIVPLTINPIIIEKPANFSYEIQNGNDVSFTWDKVENATNYRVYQIVNGEKVLKSTLTRNYVTYTFLPEGDYSYQVYSYNDRFGESSEGSVQNFPIVYPTMTAPTNPTKEITNPTSFTLSWDASPSATSYKVYQVVNGTKTLKKNATNPNVTFSNMTQGDYLYEIHSYNDRFGESSEGSRVSVSLTGQALGTPTDLTYTISNGNDIKLSWSLVPYATNYKIYKMVAGFKIFQATVTGTSKIFTNQAEGDYDYVIHSYYSLLGESPEGAEAQFSLVFPKMEKPNNLVATTRNISDITLSWNSVSYATGYNIYEIIEDQEVFVKTVTSTSATLSKVSDGVHSYVVRSSSSRFGESLEGSSIDITVTFPELQAPANITSTIINGNDISLKWTAASYATGYNIYQITDGEKVFIKSVSGTSATLSNMPEGDYTYEITTFSDRFGESTTGSAVSLSLTFPVMQSPTTLTKNIANGNDIKLSWDAVSYAASYKVYQVVDGNKTLLKTVTSTSTTLTNMPEVNYQFEIHSYSDRFGESVDGVQVAIDLIFPIMQAPGNATYTLGNGNDISLKWNSASYATSYKIYELIDGVEVWRKTVTGTSWTFTNMPEGNYNFVVHSYSDRFGESPIGSAISLNLIWPTVQPPALQGTIVNANNVTLTWNTVQWANEYRVYEVNGDNKTLLYKGTALTYKIYNLTEEVHYYQVTAYSTRFGESQLSNLIAEDIIYPEMQAPMASVKVTSPTSANISWNFVTYANGYNIYEVVDGTPVLIKENLNNLSYTLTNLSYKNHEYYVTSYSNSFGESKPSNTVLAKLIIDELPPVTTADASADWKNSSQTITLTAMDNETGVAKTFYSLNDRPFVEGTSITIDKEGINKISFYSVDKVGNTEAVQTVYSMIDLTNPETSLEQEPNGFLQSYTGTLNATDSGSGVAKTYYSINGSDFAEGTTFTVDQEGINQVSFYSVDNAGNKEETKTLEVKVDKTAPETTSDAQTGWVKEAVQVNLTAEDGQSGVAKTYYSINGSDFAEGTTFTVDQEGVNQVSFYSLDITGNKEEAKTIEVKVDKTAPETTSDAQTGWVKEAVQINLTADDSQSGVAKTYYSINGLEYVEGTTFTIDQEGVNQVSFYSVDNAGNKEEAKTIEVKVDKTAPETTSDTPTGWVKEAVQVNLTAEDGQSGVAKTYYSINGSTFEEGTTFTVDQEGVNEVSFYSVDNAGNKEEAKTIKVKVDETAPGTTSDAPTSWVNDAVQVNLTAGDSNSGVAKTYYSINGSDYIEGSTFTTNQEGINQVSFYSIDQAGNKEAPQTIEVKIDKTKPVITTNFEDYYQLGSHFKLDYQTMDLLSSIVSEKVILTAPNQAIGKVVNKLNQITLDQPGVYTLTIFATDAAGNTQTIQKQFTVYIPATVAVTPNVIKGNNGVFTLRVDLPVGFAANQLDLDTAQLNGIKALNSNKGYYNQAKLGQFKFERSDFEWTAGEQELEFRGYVNGNLVIGHTTVKVMK
jgi:large repetitive protein